jgi:hypothetical protein
MKFSPALATIFTASLLLGSGCANNQRYVSHQKERNEPQPRRLEAPFDQIREPYRNQNSATETIPHSQGQEPSVIEPELVTPGTDTTLFGIVIEGREGLVLSPYAPDKGLIDVRGFPVGAQVRDPYTGKIMKVPLPLPKKKEEAQTLSAPTFDNPNTTLAPSPTPTTPNPTLQSPPTLE